MKKSIAAILAGALCLSALTACGGSTSSSDSSAAANTGDSDKVITVGATPTPHAEILNAAKDALEAEGYTLKVVEFTDYVQPNTALVDGDLDANYFQHTPYLNNFNKENGTDLVAAFDMHYEPFGIYAGKTASIEELADGASVAIPNDGSNETRALLLLQDAGLIKLKDGIDPTSDELDRFLDAVFSACTVPISIKTRLGVHDPAEFEALLEIYSRYPVAELTIHPRVRQDFYKGRVREDAFAAALPHCPMPVCYNGDLVSERGIQETIERYPSLSALMLGRGLLGDPSLVTRVRGGERAGSARLQAFHDTLFTRYCDAFGDSRIAVLRMKELWFYFGNLFENSEKLQKSIKKAKNAEEFERAAAALFCSCEVRGNAVPAWFRPA